MKKYIEVLLVIIIAVFFNTSVLAYTPNGTNYDRNSTEEEGGNHSFCLTKDGSLWMWGGNGNGELGIGWSGDELQPKIIMNDVIYATSNGPNTAAIKKDGSLWFWGSLYHMDPHKVADNVVSVELGFSHYGLIKEDGSLWMWGFNNCGQVGVGPTEDKIDKPQKILDNVKKVVTSQRGFTLALKNDGSVWFWGSSEGERTEENRIGTYVISSPTLVTKDAIDIDSGFVKYVTLQKDGSLLEWTNNTATDGTFRASNVKILDSVRSIAYGHGNGAAIKKDGTLWAWGSNSFGQIGNGQYASPDSPQKILDHVKTVKIRKRLGNTYVAITENGDLYHWGLTVNGRGTSSDYYTDNTTPQKILENVYSVHLGRAHLIITQNDGSVWTQGRNDWGQIGNGTYDDAVFPIKIMDGADLGELYLQYIKNLSSRDENSSSQFVDIKEKDYFYKAANWAANTGVTAGVDSTHFGPSQKCTRAQVMTFLWKANGAPEPKEKNNPFVDVKTSNYYYKPVLWAVENGITTGTSPTTFSPNAACTRGQVMTFLWHANGNPPNSTNTNPFSDVKSNDYYYSPVLWAVDNQITSGTSADRFSPNQTCTRAQIVTFIWKSQGSPN